ncbi:hypothetical protein Moror_10442 [Moniliophthora roreri MCA 2997]|uniref:Integral membrane protein n=1 Tax=Moniliophthora roreri (strain MCA 2997) TaxID=1381753 RepID=V2XGC7_MONRO|nr:hypothetical protein Moror_10442 [Moniliophthora roreri MCA 2997]
MRRGPTAFFLALWLETLLYGFHTVLFIICLFLLTRRKRPGHAVFLVTATFIFIFSSLHVGFMFKDAFVRFVGKKHHHRPTVPWPATITPKTFAYVMNGFFADALVVYRCHAIWNFDVLYIIPAVVMVLVTAMVGAGDLDPHIQPKPSFFALSLATNLYVTAMAAGRLYYMGPAIRTIFARQPDFLRRYSRAFVITLETGIANSACFIIFLVLCRKDSTEGSALMVQDCFAQIMGIIPTLIIVVVGLGSDSYYKVSESETKRLRPIRTISLV